ncbi:MAG: hypothetical protein H7X77_11115 [Anaerolineae bacterium]|nr:hypothetical protein [Anaerolineae bacterium]
MRIIQKNLLSALLLGLLMMVVGGLALVSAQANPLDCVTAPGEPVTIATAKLYIEYNAAADDLGVHGAFDDHGWSELCVYDPNGTLVLHVSPQSQLKDLTMAGIFFESREPILAEFTFDNLAAVFPEGQYQVVGTNFDGTGLVGAATFTHNVPAKPVIIAPAFAPEEEQAGDFVVSNSDLVVEWEDVTQTRDGKPVVITGYEIIVTRLENTDPHGYSLPIFDVHVPADRNRLPVPVEFLEPGTGYELEVLALEESGNQTIAGGYFTTE